MRRIWGGEVILPNVSYCVNENEVHMNPYVDPCKVYDWVEIGGVRWATKNVGACDVTDAGLYFQLGDTVGYTAAEVGSGEGKKYFGWSDSPYWTADTGSGSSGYTKYNSTDGKTVLDLEDDAAHVNMGGLWRMPTRSEMKSLLTATTRAWTNDYEGSGVSGLVLTSKDDSNVKLFFPAVGNADNGSMYYVGSNGFVWSSSLSTSNFAYAHYLFFSSGNALVIDYNRCLGLSVRGVMDI